MEGPRLASRLVAAGASRPVHLSAMATELHGRSSGHLSAPIRRVMTTQAAHLAFQYAYTLRLIRL